MAKFLTNASGVTWWPNFFLIQVTPPGGQISYQCNWRHLVAKFPTNACDAIWWPNFVLMQEFPTNSCGATCWLNLLAIRYIQLWCQPMGPLCLWQCLWIKTNLARHAFCGEGRGVHPWSTPPNFPLYFYVIWSKFVFVSIAQMLRWANGRFVQTMFLANTTISNNPKLLSLFFRE